MDLVVQHTFCLGHFVYQRLKGLRHYNQREVCQLYCDTDYKASSVQGPIINFNLLRSNGDYVGYTEVSLRFFFHSCGKREFVFDEHRAQYSTCSAGQCSGANYKRLRRRGRNHRFDGCESRNRGDTDEDPHVSHPLLSLPSALVLMPGTKYPFVK